MLHCKTSVSLPKACEQYELDSDELFGWDESSSKTTSPTVDEEESLAGSSSSSSLQNRSLSNSDESFDTNGLFQVDEDEDCADSNIDSLRASYGHATLTKYENKCNLKHPIIQTERTVSTLSTSAPQGMPNMKFTRRTSSVLGGRVNEPNLFDEEPITNQLHQLHPFKPPVLLTESEPIPLTTHLDQQTHNLTEETQKPQHTLKPLHLVKFDDDEDMVGSAPNGLFLKKMKSKIDQKKRSSDYVGRYYDKFITIPTVSFNSTLSPETPQIFIGDRNAKKKLLISVGIHGDEPCGITAFNELYSEGFFDDLPKDIMITALVGNPAAVCKGQRFIEHNLNRMIHEDLFKLSTYESERGRVVAHAIDRCDVLLDLHSCSAKSPAHALPMDDSESIKLASMMPVGYVIKYLAHTTKGRATTLDWAKKKGKIGFCVECGQHDERQTIDNAKNCIKHFVYLQSGRQIELPTPPIVLGSRENEPVRKGFRFVRRVSAFEKVPFGEVIAVDDVVGPIRSKYTGGTFIVMPTRKPVLGEEAFFYAEQSTAVL